MAERAAGRAEDGDGEWSFTAEALDQVEPAA